jgi:prophage maintenance system killer protein
MVGESVPEALDQLRSRETLEGALGRPQSYAHYEEADLALQAAVLAHGIAETQPFIDGNKRTALSRGGSCDQPVIDRQRPLL